MTDKEQAGLVSIVMPAYNAEPHIREAIASVRAQTYANWELLVIDDGSRDATAVIAAGLSRQDDRIKFFQNDGNLGVSRTRNRAMALARGEWLAFLDSDDLWTPDKLEKQLEAARRTGAGFLFTGSAFITADGVPYRGTFQVPSRVTFRELCTHNVIPCSSVLIQKHFFRDIRMERDDIHEDYAAWLRILKKGGWAWGVNEPLLVYRISRGSKSGRKTRTVKMTYGVFRFIGMGPLSSAYFTARHLLGSLGKYRKLKKPRGRKPGQDGELTGNG